MIGIELFVAVISLIRLYCWTECCYSWEEAGNRDALSGGARSGIIARG